jgi:hypothetical protein
MMDAVEQRSRLLWERLRRASETKELLAAEAESSQAEHGEGGGGGGDGDLVEKTGDQPLGSGRWRWLKAVSMVTFGGRPAGYQEVICTSLINLYTWGLALPSSFSIICLLILLQIKAFFFACFFQS